MFQSTHPHRVRRLSTRKTSGRVSFNPRTHTGCDLGQGVSEIVANVSIHAPTQGATSIISALLSSVVVSIHAPTQGATDCEMT